MTMHLTPIRPWLGAEVTGLDLRHALDAQTVAGLLASLHTTGLLLFRKQDMSEQDTLRFVSYFGKISRLGSIQKSLKNGISYVSNTRADGTFGSGELLFHNDATFYETPCKAITLYGVEVPRSGGSTIFSSTAHALKQMPETLRARLARCKSRSFIDYADVDYGSRKQQEISVMRAERIYPVMMQHPWSDQTILLMSQHRSRILDEAGEESPELMRQVDEYVSDPRWTYTHQWQVGDLVFWDNFLLQHARPRLNEGESRTLRRCIVAHEDEPA